MKAKNAIPASIDLDIESLNRDERQLIQSHCEIVSFTECRVVVLGHIGRISERGDAYIEYRGIVVDQVDIRPIDPKTYRMTLGPWQDSKLAKPPPWEVPQ